jgi:hypothetical protein
LVVLPNGGGFGDGDVEDLPHKLAEVESIVSNAVYALVADSYCKLL